MARSQEQHVADPTYLEFFGLTQSPFAYLADPSQLFLSEQYSLLMEHLANAASNTDSLVVICGADGSGKTTLLNRFITNAGDHISCVVIDETCHGELQFYSAFLTHIGFEEITGTASELRNITKEFLVCRGIANDHVLIIIDNAHLTDPMILEQLRWLCEIRIKDRRVLSVVLTGNADIVRVVDAPAMRQTKFRSHVIFNIRNYSEEETANYVWHRLALAGGVDSVKLRNETSSLIHRYSGGVPHLINRLCDEMLAEAYSLESRVITDKIVRTVADKQQLMPHVVPLHGKGRRKSDPDFTHVRVVPETAGLEPENIQQQIARISEQLDDLRADKTRALQEIDARNNDIIALRGALASQTVEVEKLKRSLAIDADEIAQQNLALSDSATALQESENRSKMLATDLDKEIRAREEAEKKLAEAIAKVEDLSQPKQELQATVDDVQAELERRLEESRAECESAQRRIAELKNPEELEEIEKVSDQLAADLEKETRAREAAEKELAKATATVEELSQQKREMQATVDNVQADLEAGRKVADERAIEIESLEKNAADLKVEIDSKTGELESLRDELALRNEILADLEMRLDQSQSACELAQQRIAALKSPTEVEEIEKASDRLAADLKKETHAREAAEEELAKAIAALAELDSVQDELNSLQGRLASRDEALAELETRLEESQAECESAQLRIAALKNPEELEEVEKASDKLAANLRKEKRARKAAEKELAKATVTVAELESLRDELKSLRDRLVSRDQDVADLESWLEESQAERASALQRVSALKSPEEFEEVETAAAKLAAKLEQETGAREAAENELAKATATVDELSQLKQELQATVDDIQADLEAGHKVADERAVEIEAFEKNTADLIEEIEGKSVELDSLRDELKSLQDRLASRDQAFAELETDFEESQAERASALQRVSALKSPEEFEEVETASARLAAKLEQETGAREAAENELAKATATVEELSQLESELRAAVRDLNADLTVAGERAVDAYVLERNVTDLKDQLEKRTRELDSRNRTFADLEEQLEASQNECNLLRRRATVSNDAEVPVSKKADTASTVDTGIYSSQVVARFEQSLRKIPAYQTLQEYDPAFYEGLIATYKKLIGLDHSDKQVNDALRAKQAKLIEKLLPRASDEAIITYARLVVDQLDEFRLEGTEPCFRLLIPPGESGNNAPPVYSEKTKKRELDSLDITLRTHDADRQLPTEKDVWPDLEPIFAELFEEFGADNVAAMENSYDPGVDRVLVCNVTRALYSGTLKLRKRNAANALRWLLSSE